MSLLDDLTVLILTFNEDENISRTLDALAHFPAIVVLDSGSTDATPAIVGRYPNARLVTNPFESHERQWNFGLCSCGITTAWILALDADYVLTEDLAVEIAALRPAADVAGYRIAFRYCIGGRALKAALYPPVIALYLRQQAHYEQEGHTQRLKIRGAIRSLRNPIRHDDRKSLSRWFSSQQRYAALEADYLTRLPRRQAGRTGRIRRMIWPAPILVFVFTLLVKRCILEGHAGLFYVMQRTVAEFMISLELIERKWRNK